MASGSLTHPHSEAVSVKMQTVLPSVIQSWAEADSCQTWKSASWHDLSLLIWRFCDGSHPSSSTRIKWLAPAVATLRYTLKGIQDEALC